MGVIKQIIVFEDKLEEIFSYLPRMKYTDANLLDYKVVFGSGDKKALNVFLKTKHKGESPYPLVWLLYPYEETHNKTNLSIDKVTLILAVPTNKSMQNKQRLDETYKKVLFPLYDNMVFALGQANIVNIAHEFKVVKYPNYSDEPLDDESAGIFIWDALKVNFQITIQDTCLKPIIF